MTSQTLVLDEVYRASFRNERIPGWANNAQWRAALVGARRFILDDAMSTFMADLSSQAFLGHGGSPVTLRLAENLRVSARLPHPAIWVEYNLRAVQTRQHELHAPRIKNTKSDNLVAPPIGYGHIGDSSFDPMEVPAREGWLIQQHPTIDTAIIAHSFNADPRKLHGYNFYTFPVAYAWTVDDDTVLPWRSLPFKDTSMSAMATGLSNYKTDRASIVFSDMLDLPDPDKVPNTDIDAISRLIREWTGCLRRVWAFLATINDLPVHVTDVRASRGFAARGSFRKFLDHKTIVLTVPAKDYRKVIRKALALAHRRAHGVRGHWRIDWRHPPAVLCEHEWTASDTHMTCGHCKGRKSWIPAHQRGDASRGLVLHDYQVRHDESPQA